MLKATEGEEVVLNGTFAVRQHMHTFMHKGAHAHLHQRDELMEAFN